MTAATGRRAARMVVGLNCYGALGRCGPGADLSVIPAGSALRFWCFRSQVASDWSNLDVLVREARRRRIGLIPVLLNTWTDCAGQTDETTFRAFLLALGERYAAEPTILFWQLGNELSRPLDWYRAHAAILRATDSRHVVSYGAYNNQEHTGVFPGDAMAAIDDYRAGDAPMPAWEAKRIAACRTARVPVMVAEAGIAASVGLEMRRDWFRAKITEAKKARVRYFMLWGWRTTDGLGIGPRDPSLSLLGVV